VGKPLAGAAHAGLHLVHDQQPALGIAQRAHLLQVLGAHGVQAAFALDGLHHHGDDVGIAFGGFHQRLVVVGGHAGEALQQRAKAIAHLGVGRGGHGGDGAAVEGVVIDHDLGLGNALVHAVLAGDLDRGLVGFQAGAAEEHIGHARAVGQQLGQGFLAGHVVVVAGVDQLGDLVLQGRHQLGVVVAQGVDGDAAQCVQVFLAVHIPHAAASASLQRDRYAAVGGHNVGRGSLNVSGHEYIS